MICWDSVCDQDTCEESDSQVCKATVEDHSQVQQLNYHTQTQILSSSEIVYSTQHLDMELSDLWYPACLHHQTWNIIFLVSFNL